jgi:fatty acid desaturase
MVPYKELPESLKAPSDAWALLMIGRTWSTIVLAFLAASVYPRPLVWVAVFAVVGLMQYHLSVLGHHAMHKNLLSSPRVNDIVAGIFLLAPLGLPLSGARANHMRHHNLFQLDGDYERDNYDLRADGRDTRWGLIKWLGGAYLGGALFSTIARVLKGEGAAKTKRDMGSIVKERAIVGVVQIAIFTSVSMATDHWWAYFLLWLGPLFTLTTGFSVSRATLEHADLSEPPQRLMTFPANSVQRYIWGPFNFNWHAEHHLFAAIPACNLGRLHEYLCEHDPEFVSHTGPVKTVPSYVHRLTSLLRLCAVTAVS